MLGIDIAAASLAICAVGMLSKLIVFVKREAHDATLERAMLSSDIKLINWRLVRLEKSLGIEQPPVEL